MNKRSRLTWRCRRGMREMDILFEHFVSNVYSKLEQEEKELFDKFLDETDADIYSWIMGNSTPTNPAYKAFIEHFKNNP